MKFTRFTHDSVVYYGVLTENTITEIKGDIFGDWENTGNKYSLADVKLLAPLEPNQIIGWCKLCCQSRRQTIRASGNSGILF